MVYNPNISNEIYIFEHYLKGTYPSCGIYLRRDLLFNLSNKISVIPWYR